MENASAKQPQFFKTEEECETEFGYKFIKKNVITNDRVMSQIGDFFGKRFKDGKANPKPCNCQATEDGKCIANSCKNRQNSLACSTSCGSACRNNPWENPKYGFAAPGKTCVKRTEKTGFGLFATEPIKANEHIGVITGEYLMLDQLVGAEQQMYSIELKDLGFCIDASKMGNCQRMINHSCDPNCKRIVLGYKSALNVVNVASRNIAPGEELTVNYGDSDLNFKCHCGAANCRDANLQETVEQCGNENQNAKCILSRGLDHVHDDQQYTGIGNENHSINTIQSDSDNGNEKGSEDESESDDENDNESAQKKTSLQCAQENFPVTPTESSEEYSSPIGVSFLSTLHPVRPESYTENHEFSKGQTVYAISNIKSVLRVVQGTVVAVEKTKRDLEVVQVASVTPWQEIIYTFKYTCFHHFEDALYILEDLRTKEMEKLLLKNLASRDALEKAQQYPDKKYAESLGPKNLSLLPDLFIGPIAVGYSPNYLVKLHTTQKPAFSSKSSPRIQNRAVHRNGAPAADVVSKFQELERIYDPKDQLPIKNGVDQDDFMYPARHTVLYRRLITHCSENITWIALSRIPKTVGLTYDDLFEHVQNDLNWYYTKAPPKDRRFLIFGHFRMATEIECPGSWNLYYCSLCKLKKTFPEDHAIRNHFYSHHALVAKQYRCKCSNEFRLPSEFRQHVTNCNPEFASKFLSFVPMWLADAFSDYIRCKTKGFDLIVPGIPNFRNCLKSERSQRERRKDQKEAGIPMNLENMRPANTNIKMEPALIGIQERYRRLEDWDWLKDPVVNEKPVKKKLVTVKTKRKAASSSNQESLSSKRSRKKNTTPKNSRIPKLIRTKTETKNAPSVQPDNDD